MTRFHVWLVVMAALWVPPCLISLGLNRTPDVVTATSDVGGFISSSAAQGGFTTPTLTTVQTTAGSVVVAGSFSGARGQQLALDRKLKSGLQLCVADSPEACAAVSGTWPGRLRPVPHHHPALAFLAPMQRGDYLRPWYFFATFSTLPLSLLCAIFGRPVGGGDEGDHTSAKPGPSLDDPGRM